MEELKIIPLFETKLIDGELKITNFELIKKAVEELVTQPVITSEIANADDKKNKKQIRTQIGKRRDEIKNGRLIITRKFLSKFEKDCKEIEKTLDNAYKDIGNQIEKYEIEKEGKVKIKAWKLTVNSISDEKVLEKLKALLTKANIEYKLEEK